MLLSTVVARILAASWPFLWPPVIVAWGARFVAPRLWSPAGHRRLIVGTFIAGTWLGALGAGLFSANSLRVGLSVMNGPVPLVDVMDTMGVFVGGIFVAVVSWALYTFWLERAAGGGRS